MSSGLAQQQSRLKELISRGREQGYLTYNDINDSLPEDIVTAEDLDEVYIKLRNLPQNPLVPRGYKSIGCAPCTRALKPHEHERAGRWWWEAGSDKECGLHQTPLQVSNTVEGPPLSQGQS